MAAVITVRALHDGIFAVSSDLDTWPDDCFPPPQPSCKSCLCWIRGRAYVCEDCNQHYCNAPCAATERHKLCAGRQAAIDRLPSTESHQKRMASAAAYGERQKVAMNGLARPRTPAQIAQQLAAQRRYREKKKVKV